MMQTAQTRDGVRIAYRHTKPTARGADAPRAVLIHSLALDHSVWDAVAGRLASDVELLALDCRGHGTSDIPSGPYTVEQFADDVADVMDRVGWSSAIVVGCSMGGCVAQAFAARHPRRVEGLALIDTTAWYGPDAPRVWRERAARARADGLASMAAFQTTRWFGDRFRELHPDIVHHAMQVFCANAIEAYDATCAMLGDADLRPALGGFSFPTAIVVGEEDYATPYEAAEYMRTAIPSATLTVIPAARHLTPMECPDIIAQEIRTVSSRRSPLTTTS